MTTATPNQQPTGAVPAADPRVGQLLDFAQGLLTGYSDLATTFAEDIATDEARRRLLDQAQKVLAEARSRYATIALSS
ncbi:hypothetical protein [Kitasatospora sp. NPDC090091]|uniref:hypothetical protein n=1 Tax=Kitasatospora sp. NPDC090091 TaxID=3364081 RepID=UPI0037F2E7ED